MSDQCDHRQETKHYSPVCVLYTRKIRSIEHRNYRNKSIIGMYKTTQTNFLMRIYQFIHVLDKKIDKNKNKPKTKINLNKTT